MANRYGNTLFPVAVHALTSVAALTEARGSLPAQAATIARSIDTHVVVVRRLLGRMAKAGFVIAVRGKEGGYLLARSPHRIRLSEILSALGEDRIFPMHPKRGNPSCPVSRNVKDVLGPIVDSAQQKLVRDLARHTLDDVLIEIQKREA